MNNAFNLLMATNDGVKSTCASSGGKINTHLINGGGFRMFGVTLVWGARLAEHLDRLCTHFFEVNAQAFKDTCGNTFTLTY